MLQGFAAVNKRLSNRDVLTGWKRPGYMNGMYSVVNNQTDGPSQA